jgi:hypothetical protein
MAAKQHHHHAKAGVFKPLHRGPVVNLVCTPPLGAIEQAWMIHQKRIKLAPLMTSHGHGATSVLVVWKRAGHPTDNLTSTAILHTCCNLQPVLKTRSAVIGLNNNRSRQRGWNGNATGLTEVQVD